MQVKSIAECSKEHSAMLSTFIQLPFVIKMFILSIFEWPFYTGFTVECIHVGQKKTTLYLKLCELASMNALQFGVLYQPYGSHVPSSTEEGRLIEHKLKALEYSLCKTTEKLFHDDCEFLDPGLAYFWLLSIYIIYIIGHRREKTCLISAFVVHMLERNISRLATSEISIF